MSDIFLLLADDAVCEAIIEQIIAAKIGTPRRCDDARALVKQREEGSRAVVILDHAANDKKNASMIETLNEATSKSIILKLGTTEETTAVTETFVKPFRLGHLMARLRYYLDTEPLLHEQKIITFGPYRLEPQSRRIVSETTADPIRLTEKETALLVFLAHNSQPVTRREILASVWGYDERIDTHTLETHIYQLRRKLDSEDGGGESWLINEAGAYRLARGPE